MNSGLMKVEYNFWAISQQGTAYDNNLPTVK